MRGTNVQQLPYTTLFPVCYACRETSSLLALRVCKLDPRECIAEIEDCPHFLHSNHIAHDWPMTAVCMMSRPNSRSAS